eukprot:m.59705 g.59705  ORF g.59705 m.59705 type:complete len:185 (+) comp11266_c0_seq1:160-714(+)
MPKQGMYLAAHALLFACLWSVAETNSRTLSCVADGNGDKCCPYGMTASIINDTLAYCTGAGEDCELVGPVHLDLPPCALVGDKSTKRSASNIATWVTLIIGSIILVSLIAIYIRNRNKVDKNVPFSIIATRSEQKLDQEELNEDLLTVSLSDDDEEEDVIIPSVANLPTIEIDHGADTDEKTSL